MANRLGIIRDQILVQVKAATDDAVAAVFATPDDEVKLQGEHLKRVVLPVATIVLEDQDAEELETTTKQSILLPWSVKVEFDKKSGSAPNVDDLHAIHDELFGAIYNSMMSTDALRRLTTSGPVINAVDTKYLRGGSALTPEDVDEDSDRWSFTIHFETHYRHAVGDPSTRV